MDGLLSAIPSVFFFSVTTLVILMYVGTLLNTQRPFSTNTYIKWGSAVFLLTVFLGAISASLSGCTFSESPLTFGIEDRVKVIG